LKKVIIFGASGLLGTHSSVYLYKNGFEVYSIYFKNPINSDIVKSIQLDIQNEDSVWNMLCNVKPDLILNCSGLTSVEECESNQKDAIYLHEKFPGIIAKFSSDTKIKNIHISTDHLWDGKKSFYKESDPTTPINVYGITKANGEKLVLHENPSSLIIRTNFFGKGTSWRKSFSDWAIEKLKDQANFYGFEDVYFTPISIPLLLDAIYRFIDINASGIFHVAGSERISKHDFIIEMAKFLKFNHSHLHKSSYRQIHGLINRPLDMSLDTNKVSLILNKNMPSVIESIASII
jgi:dTDP-4-dehydrorhamnose reductase